MTIHRLIIGESPLNQNWMRRVIESSCGAPAKDWGVSELYRASESWKYPIISLANFPNRRVFSNYVRYQLLYEYGGLWLDWDVIPLVDLRDAKKDYVASWEGNAEGGVMNVVSPKTKWVEGLLLDAYSLITQGASEGINTGALLLRKHLRHYPDVEKRELFPFGSDGTKSYRSPYSAVHLWHSSSEYRIPSQTRSLYRG